MKVSAKKLKGKLWYLYKNPVDNLIIADELNLQLCKAFELTSWLCN